MRRKEPIFLFSWRSLRLGGEYGLALATIATGFALLAANLAAATGLTGLTAGAAAFTGAVVGAIESALPWFTETTTRFPSAFTS